MKYFSVTPLSWRVYVEADTSGFVKGDAYCIDVTIKSGDRTLETVSGEGSGWIDESGQGEISLFAEPDDTAEITSITVCGQTFQLK